jgi:hypothetical protein
MMVTPICNSHISVSVAHSGTIMKRLTLWPLMCRDVPRPLGRPQRSQFHTRAVSQNGGWSPPTPPPGRDAFFAGLRKSEQCGLWSALVTEGRGRRQHGSHDSWAFLPLAIEGRPSGSQAVSVPTELPRLPTEMHLLCRFPGRASCT